MRGYIVNPLKLITSLIIPLIFSFQISAADTYNGSCSEDDNGKNAFKKGAVTLVHTDQNCATDESGPRSHCIGFSTVERDYCKSDKVLVEQYCENNIPAEAFITCPDNMECVSGQCQKAAH